MWTWKLKLSQGLIADWWHHRNMSSGKVRWTCILEVNEEHLEMFVEMRGGSCVSSPFWALYNVPYAPWPGRSLYKSDLDRRTTEGEMAVLLLNNVVGKDIEQTAGPKLIQFSCRHGK